MSFMVDMGNRRPRFKTLEEASEFANRYLKKTGVILCITEDKRPANASLNKK